MLMPMKRFWAFNGNIDRIASEESLRGLNVAICAQSSEGVKDLSERLTNSMGAVVVREVVKDTQSIENFKKLFL